MYTLNYKYKNRDENSLIDWLSENDLASKKECLVQLFFGILKEDEIQNIISLLVDKLPESHIIGSTTDGEIVDDIVETNSIVISITVFEKSTISSTSVNYDTHSYDMGYKIAKELDSDDVKAMILFTTGLSINGESFLDGVRKISKGNYIVSGGMAGDNGAFKKTYISHQGKVISKGAVGVVLKGDELNVKNNYKFGWDAVGLPMKITKSIENRVYELDNKPIIDIYTKYFSKEISDLLPVIGVEIPLIVDRDGRKIARACINKFDDGSLLFGGNLKQGEEVRFGLGGVDSILKDSERICSSISKTCNPETVFVYSCMARRRLLESQASLELKVISSKTAVSGFFTYGEFYSDEKNNYLFNETMTILALSEKVFDTRSEPVIEENVKIDIESNKLMYAVTHMTNVIAREWQERVDEEIAKNKEEERQSFQKNKLAQMGEMIGMIAHQWRQPLNAISATGINLSLLSSMKMLEDSKVQESSVFIQDQCQKMSTTIDTFMNFVRPSQESKKFYLNHTVEAIMQIMGTQLANHDIEVNIDMKDENISIIGYEDLLEQVIINILSNARDAFSELEKDGKFIKIIIDSDSEYFILIIQDNAGGIPKEISDKIFNPYFTTKEQGKGTGIGLYMSMDIIKKSFGGDLVYNPIKDGSEFKIVIGKDTKTEKVKMV